VERIQGLTSTLKQNFLTVQTPQCIIHTIYTITVTYPLSISPLAHVLLHSGLPVIEAQGSSLELLVCVFGVQPVALQTRVNMENSSEFRSTQLAK
jgi:hypothetical protein